MKIPDFNDLQKEVNEFLKQKYGEQVQATKPEFIGEKVGSEVKPIKNEIHFNLKPKELEEYLNQYIIGQDDAIRVLSTKVCTHFNRMMLEKKNPKAHEVMGRIKNNILMIGPTGVGKTYIMKLVAKKLGVPFVKGDATKFSETGYVGGDVEDLVRELVQEADGDIEAAEYGIIYLDEIDKIAASFKNVSGPDVSRTGVQRNLLKIMEDSEVDLKVPHDLASQMEAVMQAQKTGKVERKKVSTKNMLFVLCGAFPDLIDIIKKRLNQQSIGFSSEVQKSLVSDESYLKFVQTEDLIKFGFETEFVGRLPVITVLNELNVDGLYHILKNEFSSVILGKKKDFEAYGIEINFEDQALLEIAKRAHREKTGARGLVSVVEKLMINFERELPSSNITHLTISEKTLESPSKYLQSILLDDAIRNFCSDFFELHNITLEFTEEAKDIVEEKHFSSNQDYDNILNELFHNYEYGLKLIGKDYLLIDKNVISNNVSYLEGLIKSSYNKK